ncbi:carbohydrate ABC transporter permease [Paenibacillus planticolens]|uniref:ABC transporter permease subunit n=1 Tax=Paenibacillus planticolens TaxID=2654976 RepID=A0ABX1ZF13_9BACL|nr:sugar ABC transporter permease [Paenibacillus planticolens]NOU98693.1 ABC transporter permease subunit [Paenibacillus planticolens]
MRRMSDSAYAWFNITPAILVVFGIVLFPLIYTFILSLYSMSLTVESMGDFVGLQNYINALTDSTFWASTGRTAYFSFVSISIEIVLGLMIALLVNEKIKGMAILRSIIILPWAVPTIVNGAMWKWIYHPEYGALNAFLTQLHIIPHYQSWLSKPWLAMNMVIVSDVWKMTPLVVIFLLASLQMTNKSVYEAASVDGANMIRRFFILTLPHLKPMILVIIVMRTMETFKVFDLVYALTMGGPSDGTKVLTYQAYVKAFNNLQFSQGATISFLIAIMIGLMTLVYVKTLKAEGESA